MHPRHPSITPPTRPWQPIATAPQNGTRVRVGHELDPNSLNVDSCFKTTGIFRDGEWICSAGFVCIDMMLRWKPTHWLPEKEQRPARDAALVGGETTRAKPDGPLASVTGVARQGRTEGTAGETAPITRRIRERQPALFEVFEKAERARPRGAAARENDARALERQADHLRLAGTPLANAKADALDREAMALRASRVAVAA